MDILIERDDRDNRLYFLTSKTERGDDWMMGYATERSCFLGKSLIVNKWDLPRAVEMLEEANVEYRRA